MQKTKLLIYEQYKKYQKFIAECSDKEYSSELVLHRHHIVPKFISAQKEYKDLTVLLSVEDHITAHILLSKCFDEGSKESVGNLRAAKILGHKSIKYKKDLEKIYRYQRGDLNPSKLPENRKKIAEGLRKYYESNSHPAKGRTYKEIYGTKADEEKKKRAKTTRTKQQYKASAAKAAEKNRGKVSWNGKKIEFKGNIYRSIKNASETTNISEYLIKKECKYL